MTRFARSHRVFFFEEHIPCHHPLPYLEFHCFEGTEVVAVRPRLPHDWNEAALADGLRRLLNELLVVARIDRPILWFYTPLMYRFADAVDASALVYDCMDQLSNFKHAPEGLLQQESRLIERADLVFTGGHSLFEAKRHLHDNIHAIPSAVDTRHFTPSRSRAAPDPADQQAIARPRLGFCGVIDERIDCDLLAAAAAARPEWQFVLLGPVVKIDPATLPRAANLHYLGAKDYAELPEYFAGWDIALMPFARSEATRFISPTKTPEYLAAGLPVVSTAITDVVRQYGHLDAVQIAGDPAAFIAGCEAALRLAAAPGTWRPAVDTALAPLSWETAFQEMRNKLTAAIERRAAPVPPAPLSGRRRRTAVRAVPGCRAAYDYLIVGAGFAGSVLAERLAAALLVSDDENGVIYRIAQKE